MEKGIKINNTLIKKISGPVSFYLFTLNNSRYAKNIKNSGINPPVIILFGDTHLSYENMCENCICKNIEECCLKIQDKNFISLLDNLASTIKIDFNIEQEFDLNYLKEYYEHYENKGPLPSLLLTIKDCLFKTTDCPTKNIKWNYVDIRLTEKKFNYNYESSIINIFDYFSAIESELVEEPDIKNIEDKYNYILDSIISINNYYKTFLQKSRYINTLNNVIESLNNKTFFNIFEIGNRNKSLIYKQIRKLNEPYNDITYWENKLNKYTKYIFNERLKDYNKEINNFIKVLKIHVKLCKFIFDNSNKKDIKDYIIINFQKELDDYIEILDNDYDEDTIEIIKIAVTSIFLDIYYITRALKIPKSEKNSILSIGYFGNNHVKNLTYFLTNILCIYDINESIDYSGTQNRCIDFSNKYIDLDKIIEEHS